jgi:hypothetical protein
MLISVKKPHTNVLLSAPVDWDSAVHGECKQLHVCKFSGVMYSYWKLSFIDRLRVLFGRTIRLAVIGNNHPPVSLDTEKF